MAIATGNRLFPFRTEKLSPRHRRWYCQTRWESRKPPCLERVFRREIVWRLFFVFIGLRGNAVQDIPVFCGWGIWPASLLPLRSKFCTCPRHLSTQVSLRPVPAAGLCGPGVTCFPVGMLPGPADMYICPGSTRPMAHVCEDRLRFDPLDRSMWP